MTKQEEVKLFYEFLVKKNLLMLVVSYIDINTSFQNKEIQYFVLHTHYRLRKCGIAFPFNKYSIHYAWANELTKRQII